MSYNSTAYNENYYKSHCGECYERGHGWEEIFARQADIIKRDFKPQTTLDVGCAAGYLVEGLRDLDVEAYGMDISEYALSMVRDDIKPYCWIQSATSAIEKKYDLITCIEVLEHLESEDIRKAIQNLCQATETIIFSSTPFDYEEETHYSVNQPGYWVEEFLANGFYHDIDYDCSYIAVQTMLFRKRNVDKRELVRNYENKLFQLWNQCCILRDKNNLSTARIADLNRGNIEHAIEIQEYQNKISDIEQSNKLMYEELQRRHVVLMKAEYEKRDILECKFEVLKSEKEFLQSELQKCIHKNSILEQNAENFNMKHSIRKLSDIGIFGRVKNSLKYKMQTRRLLKEPLSFWTPVFNPVDYAEINSDIYEKIGNDENELLRHFIIHGMNEGRRANKNFDINTYILYNKDVADIYNGNLRNCYLHYIENGQKEGRRI